MLEKREGRPLSFMFKSGEVEVFIFTSKGHTSTQVASEVRPSKKSTHSLIGNWE